MQGFLSVVSPDSFLPFVPVFLSSVSEPCPYPSCLCLPSRTSFFHYSAPWFTTTTHKEPMAPLACACAFGSVAHPARLVVVNERFERNPPSPGYEIFLCKMLVHASATYCRLSHHPV